MISPSNLQPTTTHMWFHPTLICNLTKPINEPTKPICWRSVQPNQTHLLLSTSRRWKIGALVSFVDNQRVSSLLRCYELKRKSTELEERETKERGKDRKCKERVCWWIVHRGIGRAKLNLVWCLRRLMHVVFVCEWQYFNKLRCLTRLMWMFFDFQ